MARSVPFSIRRDGCCALALVLFILLAFSPFVFGPYSLQDSVSSTSSLYPTGSRQPADGNMSVYRILDPGAPAWQTEPEFVLEHAIVFGEKRLPTWNPYSAYGTPLLANMQSQPLTPLAWLAIGSPTALAYNLFVVFRLIVAALLAYAYCRLFTGYVAAFCGGICYAFSGFFLLYVAMPELSVDVVAPALLIAIELQSRRPSAGSVVGIAFAVALSIFGGMPEETFLFFTFAAIYAVVRQAFLGTAIGMVLGTGLAAILVVPFLEYVGQSFSTHGSGAMVGTNADPLSLSFLATYVAPLLYGPPYNNIFQNFSGYSGVRDFFGPAACTLAFATCIDFANRTGRIGKFPKYLFQIVFIVLLAKRFALPGAQLLGSLPILRQIILLKYDEPVMALCVAVLVAYAVERMNVSSEMFWPLLGSSTGVLIVLSAVAAISGPEADRLASHRSYFFGSLSFGLIVVGAIICVSLLERSLALSAAIRQRAIVTLVIVGAVGTYFIPMYYVVDQNPHRSSSTILGAPYVAAAKASMKDGRRFFSPDSLLYPEWSAAFAMPDVRALDALYDSHYLPFVRAFMKTKDADFFSDRFVGVPGLDFSDVRVRHWMQLSSIGTVAVENAHRGLEGLQPFYNDGTVRLYRINDTQPVVAAFTKVIRVASDARALDVLTDPHFDPSTSAVVEAPATAFHVSGKPSHFIGGNLQVADSTYIRAHIGVPNDSLIVASMTNYPGWQAYVDGKRAQIVRANYLFRGVAVSPGVHTLEFRYEPTSLKVGAIVSAVALAFSLVLIVSEIARYRRDHRIAVA